MRYLAIGFLLIFCLSFPCLADDAAQSKVETEVIENVVQVFLGGPFSFCFTYLDGKRLRVRWFEAGYQFSIERDLHILVDNSIPSGRVEIMTTREGLFDEFRCLCVKICIPSPYVFGAERNRGKFGKDVVQEILRKPYRQVENGDRR